MPRRGSQAKDTCLVAGPVATRPPARGWRRHATRRRAGQDGPKPIYVDSYDLFNGAMSGKFSQVSLPGLNNGL